MTKTQLDPRSSIRACLCTEDFCNHDQTGKFCGCGDGDNYHHHLQSPVHQLDLKIFFRSNFIKSRIRSPVLWSPCPGDINVKLLWQHCLKIQGATYADCDGVYMVTDSSVESTNDTFVQYFGWMKKKSQNSSTILAFHNIFFCLECWTTSFMFCSGAMGKGQAGVCTQKQRQVESWGRKHKSTEFNILWDELNTLWLKLNENPSWYFPWSIWVYMYHVNLIGPSFITCAESGYSIKK